MTALAHNNAFIAYMNEHRRDAWGAIITTILTSIYRQERDVLTFSYDPETIEATLLPPHQYMHTGNCLLTFTFARDIKAVAHLTPIADTARRIQHFNIDEIILTCPTYNVVE